MSGSIKQSHYSLYKTSVDEAVKRYRSEDPTGIKKRRRNLSRYKYKYRVNMTVPNAINWYVLNFRLDKDEVMNQVENDDQFLVGILTWCNDHL